MNQSLICCLKFGRWALLQTMLQTCNCSDGDGANGWTENVRADGDFTDFSGETLHGKGKKTKYCDTHTHIHTYIHTSFFLYVLNDSTTLSFSQLFFVIKCLWICVLIRRNLQSTDYSVCVCVCVC